MPYAEAVRHGRRHRHHGRRAPSSRRRSRNRSWPSGRADLIALGRELMADPNWAYRAARELGLERPWQVLPDKYAFYLERRAAVLED